MIAATDDYLSELRKQLAARYWPNQRVRDAVDEARQHLDDTDERPVEAFGDPADYADALDAAWRKRDRPLPVRVAAGVAAVLLGAIGGTLIGAVLGAESGLTGTVEVPIAQPFAFAALFLLPSVVTRVRRRSASTRVFLLAALVVGGLAGLIGGLLRSRGVDVQMSTRSALLVAGASFVACIAIGTVFFGAPWRRRRTRRTS